MIHNIDEMITVEHIKQALKKQFDLRQEQIRVWFTDPNCKSLTRLLENLSI